MSFFILYCSGTHRPKVSLPEPMAGVTVEIEDEPEPMEEEYEEPTDDDSYEPIYPSPQDKDNYHTETDTDGFSSSEIDEDMLDERYFKVLFLCSSIFFNYLFVYNFIHLAITCYQFFVLKIQLIISYVVH